jgi:AP-1 complex subunit gamma-1
VKDDIWHALIVVLSNASEFQGYSVRSLYTTLQAYNEQVRENFVLFIIMCHSMSSYLMFLTSIWYIV